MNLTIPHVIVLGARGTTRAMTSRTCLAVVLWLASACGAAADAPTIDDATPQEAAQTVTDVSCEKAAECGYISASCTPCAAGEVDCEPTCTVEARSYSQAECIEDTQEDLERGFGCQELTPDEVALVNECLAAAPDEACPSVQDVEAWVDGGRQGRDPRAPIAACDLLFDDIIYRCEEGE